MGVAHCSCKRPESQTNPATNQVKHRTPHAACNESTSESSKYSKSLLPLHRLTDSGEDRFPLIPEIFDEFIDDFYKAIAHGNLPMVKAVVHDHPEIPFLRTRFKELDTCLHLAVRRKAHSVLEFLLTLPDAKVERPITIKCALTELLHVRSEDHHGDTPLHIAVRLRDTKSVRLLHKRGANAEFKNNKHETSTNIAVQNRDNAVLKALGKLYDSDENLFKAPPQKNRSVGFITEVHAVSPDPDRSVSGESPRERQSPDVGRPTEFALDILSVNQPAEGGKPRKTIKGRETEALNDIANDVLFDIQQTIRIDRNNILTLENWLEKKQHAPPFGFHTRWCVVSGRHMVWSNIEIKVGDEGMTQKERKRWNKCINLFLVTDVSEIADKKKRKFKITVQDHRHHTHDHHHHHHHHHGKKHHKKKKKLFVREYIFRAQSKSWRDKWVKGLNDHIDHIKKEWRWMKQSESKYHGLDEK